MADGIDDHVVRASQDAQGRGDGGVVYQSGRRSREDGGGILASTEARLLDRAVKADPSYSYARAFRAIIAYRSGDAAAAKRYLADFKANDPSAEALGAIEQMGLEAKIEALAKSSTTSTTQPTTTKPAG